MNLFAKKIQMAQFYKFTMAIDFIDALAALVTMRAFFGADHRQDIMTIPIFKGILDLNIW
jgi:hypothetical protein